MVYSLIETINIIRYYYTTLLGIIIITLYIYDYIR